MASSDPTATTQDYYSLLQILPSSSESEIRRAYRKTSRLYHPDKVTPTPENLEKFHLLQSALNILTDPVEKAKYDAVRDAKQRREAENALLEGRRRKMKEDLERAENGSTPGSTTNGTNGVKRTWSERDIEIKRIAEENRRKREEVMARKMKSAAEDQKLFTEQQEQKQQKEEGGGSQMDRSVKVRWIKEGDGLDIDDVALTEMFPAGEVEDVVLLKDKKRKVDGRDKKFVMGTAVLVFKSIQMARKAVSRGKTEELDSVEWAAGEKDKD